MPTDLGGVTYLPGQLVAWNGASFALLHADAAWPPASRIVGFSLASAAVAGPGAIPPTLTVSRVSGTVVRLSWAMSCGTAASDYAIYEGEIGNWYSHALVDCSDDGADLAEDVTPAAGDRYFLVVPHDAASAEGSYGTDALGVERPRAATTCQPVQIAGGCP